MREKELILCIIVLEYVNHDNRNKCEKGKRTKIKEGESFKIAES